MAFYGYKGDVGECHWTPYGTSSYDYDVVSPQASVTYSSSYEFDEPKLIEDGPYGYLDSSTTQQLPNYFVYNYTQPRVIQYEPPPCARASFYYSRNNYNISNTAIEFDLPEFEEYDPTPYGGGYDIAQTYGKPLLPSDEICYPRSTPQKDVQFPEGFSYGSIPSPYGDDNNHSIKPLKDKDSEPVDKQEKQTHGDSGDKVMNGGGNTEGKDLQKPIEAKRTSDVDEHPSSDYNDGFGSGVTGGYGCEWNRQVPYTPYGSGLEAMDLCESIFGYWPCLAKINRQRNANCAFCNEERQNEPWKSMADYLFGNPFVDGEQRDGGNGYHFYNNENYYQPQYPYQ